ncbi:MAG: 2-oxoglutarate dehydrogenase E1 component [Flavobacteriales bacterium]
MDDFGFLGNSDISAIDDLYLKYREDKSAVDPGWAKFFEGFEFARKAYPEKGEVPEAVQKEFRVLNLINGYRTRGHLFTKTNPVRKRRQYRPTLDIENFGLEQADLAKEFEAGEEIGIGKAKLSDIIAQLQKTYCRSVGAEYMYIRVPKIVNWLKEKMEKSTNQRDFTVEEKTHMVNKLTEAVIFEKFLGKKFVGQKRFSLEGAETLIPALDEAIEAGADLGVESFVLGMSHRGRLNVLANILRKDHRKMFAEFEESDYKDLNPFEGDVKYHLGYSSDTKTEKGKKVHLSLSPNPSHLEAVAPVAEGIARAKIDLKYKSDNNKVVPIIIHGDAAIAGQGVVYEVLQMSRLDGYQTGGSIHIVVNNQIGFTTDYLDARSSTYCTDVGKVTLAPIFHVNGDDVEALVYTMSLAMEFRQTFHRDVFIDLLCYRKHGHNEGDEPRFTQPLLYKIIAKHPNPLQIYTGKLVEDGLLDASIVEQMESEFNKLLQAMLDEARTEGVPLEQDFFKKEWAGIRSARDSDFDRSPGTGVGRKQLLRIAEKINTVPKGVKVFRKMEKIMADRRKMVSANKLDWGMCELLAYGTLLEEGHLVRFSGQDSERGTFSHRHAVLKVEDSEDEYTPLCHISDKQAGFYIYNSLLSEYAVLGFEYGYALANPNGLTIWEAQFGDFANGAQIIADQFISSAEEKWLKHNGIILLLPHGYEGMGAEHSSARVERWLQLCAKNNMQVVNCSTPANFFHALRRQLKRPFRKPLIVMTPKKLLRYPRCVSSLDDLSKGGFQEVIDEDATKPENVKSVVFCNGKFYYDLLEEREKRKGKGPALVRIEQLYPMPLKQLKRIVRKYKHADSWVWAQEEPENMGGWSYYKLHFTEVPLVLKSPPANPACATGSHIKHEQRHRQVIESVFNT